MRSLCITTAGGVCIRVIFTLRPNMVAFWLMQMKPAQVLSKLPSKHCSAFGTATCWVQFNRNAQSCKSSLSWTHVPLTLQFPTWFWLKTQVMSVVHVCMSVGISRQSASLPLVVLDLLPEGLTWENWQSHTVHWKSISNTVFLYLAIYSVLILMEACLLYVVWF